MHDIRESGGHHGNGQSGGGAPVDENTLSDVVIVGVEIDEAAPAVGPVTGHACACLVGAEGLSEDDVGKPGCVYDFARSKNEIPDEGPEGS